MSENSKKKRAAADDVLQLEEAEGNQ